MLHDDHRFLKRESETLGWLELPELGRKDRRIRARTWIAIAGGLFVFWITVAIALAGMVTG